MVENVKLTVSVNDGPPQTGPIAGGIQVAPLDVVRLGHQNTSGAQRYRFELKDYPNGFALPPGWSQDGLVYYYDGPSPPTFTVPDGSAIWGNWLPRLIVNNGLRPSSTRPGEYESAKDLIDESLGIEKPGQIGISDVAFGETGQFDPDRLGAGAVKELIRHVETVVVAAGGEANTATSIGGGVSIAAGKTGTVINLASFEGDGQYIDVTRTGDLITIELNSAALTGLLVIPDGGGDVEGPLDDLTVLAAHAGGGGGVRLTFGAATDGRVMARVGTEYTTVDWLRQGTTVPDGVVSGGKGELYLYAPGSGSGDLYVNLDGGTSWLRLVDYVDWGSLIPINADTDDLSTGVDTRRRRSVVRLAPGAPGHTISGFDDAGIAQGHEVVLLNTTANGYTIEHLGAGSSTQHRVLCPDAADLEVPGFGAVHMLHNSTNWQITAVSAAGAVDNTVETTLSVVRAATAVPAIDGTGSDSDILAYMLTANMRSPVYVFRPGGGTDQLGIYTDEAKLKSQIDLAVAAEMYPMLVLDGASNNGLVSLSLSYNMPGCDVIARNCSQVAMNPGFQLRSIRTLDGGGAEWQTFGGTLVRPIAISTELRGSLTIANVFYTHNASIPRPLVTIDTNRIDQIDFHNVVRSLPNTELLEVASPGQDGHPLTVNRTGHLDDGRDGTELDIIDGTNITLTYNWALPATPPAALTQWSGTGNTYTINDLRQRGFTAQLGVELPEPPDAGAIFGADGSSLMARYRYAIGAPFIEQRYGFGGPIVKSGLGTTNNAGHLWSGTQAVVLRADSQLETVPLTRNNVLNLGSLVPAAAAGSICTLKAHIEAYASGTIGTGGGYGEIDIVTVWDNTTVIRAGFWNLEDQGISITLQPGSTITVDKGAAAGDRTIVLKVGLTLMRFDTAETS